MSASDAYNPFGNNVLDEDAPATLSNASSGYQRYDPSRWDARGQVFFLDVSWEVDWQV